MKPSEVDDSDLGFELYHATASTILPLLKRGTLTAEKYVCSLLARIQQRDENVQAWAYLDADYAIREAKMLDQIPEEQRGPLHGIPIAVKDMINTKGPALQSLF
jgi:amidase